MIQYDFSEKKSMHEVKWFSINIFNTIIDSSDYINQSKFRETLFIVIYEKVNSNWVELFFITLTKIKYWQVTLAARHNTFRNCRQCKVILPLRESFCNNEKWLKEVLLLFLPPSFGQVTLHSKLYWIDTSHLWDKTHFSIRSFFPAGKYSRCKCLGGIHLDVFCLAAIILWIWIICQWYRDLFLCNTVHRRRYKVKSHSVYQIGWDVLFSIAWKKITTLPGASLLMASFPCWWLADSNLFHGAQGFWYQLSYIHTGSGQVDYALYNVHWTALKSSRLQFYTWIELGITDVQGPLPVSFDYEKGLEWWPPHAFLYAWLHIYTRGLNPKQEYVWTLVVFDSWILNPLSALLTYTDIRICHSVATPLSAVLIYTYMSWHHKYEQK